MIYVFIRGRLGNQLFQYAFIRTLQETNPLQEVIYIFNEVYQSGDVQNGWENSLKYFNTVGVKEETVHKVNLSFLQKVSIKLYWEKYPHNASIEEKNRYQMRWLPWLSKNGLYYLDLGYYKFPKVLRNKSTIVSGNFESYKYFESIKDKIKIELTPREPLLEKNKSLYEMIKKKNSVCITIRRGDFVSNQKFNQLLNICTKTYFDRAIERMKQLVPDLTLFFFSDDIRWTKKNLHYNIESYYEDGGDPVWEKLRLMYSCKHFIISNSTFSWWAQYLGNDQNKRVIAPSKWYNNNFTVALYQDTWELIEVE